MAQAALVRSILTDEMIELGRTLLTRLDEEGVVFEAALWLLDEEIQEWRLVLASGLIRTSGPRMLYRKIGRCLSGLGADRLIPLEMVSVVDERSQLVQSLRRALGSATSVDGTRLDGATIEGTRLPGCVLYRLRARQRIAAAKAKAS